jgi:hypothetical protein
VLAKTDFGDSNPELIVLDKSYLQGASPSAIADLCSQYLVVMPDALFYELMTTSDYARRWCFNKLSGNNSIKLTRGIGDLLRYECQHIRPCTPLLERRLIQVLSFNPRLREAELRITADQEVALTEWQNYFKGRVTTFREFFPKIIEYFPKLTGYIPGQKPNIEFIGICKKAVATDWDMVRKIYAAVQRDPLPPAYLIDPNWACFRWIQVWLTASLDHFAKYGENSGVLSDSEMFNEVLDLEYLITSALAGGLASRDKAMISRFKLLCPATRLVQ